LVALPGGTSLPVSGNLTEDEVKMSSAAREVTGFLRLLEVTAQLYPDKIRNSTIQLIGDSQSAVQAINQRRSRSSDMNEILKRVFSLCIASGFLVSAVWKPREMLEIEDLLSREPVASD
jgi:hypothetical protein